MLQIKYAFVFNATITVDHLFPPRESCSSRVSLESRYGTWLPFFSWSPSAEITLPKASCKEEQIDQIVLLTDIRYL